MLGNVIRGVARQQGSLLMGRYALASFQQSPAFPREIVSAARVQQQVAYSNRPSDKPTEVMELYEKSIADQPNLISAHQDMINLYKKNFGQDIDPDLPLGEKLATYTKEEVAMHNNIDDCWIIVDGMVLDITNFVRHHPGGAKEIKPYFGEDATEAYHSVIPKHSGKANEMRKTWVIGRVGPKSSGAPHPVHEQLGMFVPDPSDGVRRPTSMFCFQCSGTKHGTGCNTVGVCGKVPEVACLQDLLLYQLAGLGYLCEALGEVDADVIRTCPKKIFMTLTNVNFDPDVFYASIAEMDAITQKLRKKVEAAGKATPALKASAAYGYTHQEKKQHAIDFAQSIGVKTRADQTGNADLHGLREMILYGLKGTGAYYFHADMVAKAFPNKFTISKEDEYNFIKEFMRLTMVSNAPVKSMDDILQENLAAGKLAIKSMDLLDAAQTSAFGHPTPATIKMRPRPGKAILVSGHDIVDLYHVCEQAEKMGIDVYTHGELLPAHGYPELRKFKCLAGNFGRAWYRQQTDFNLFPGPTLLTSNCMIAPKDSYASRLFTTGPVNWPGIPYLKEDDFSALFEKVKECKGFTEEYIKTLPHRICGEDYTLGFGRNFLTENIGQVLDAVKEGKLKNIWVMGGCNGWEPERAYYPQVATTLPKEAILLSVGCKQYKFRNIKFGGLDGTALPKYMPVGQCNDTYTLFGVARKLSEELKIPIKDLPLHIALGWMEQKSVCILQACLYLGISKIKFGPVLPAYLTPNVVSYLSEKLGWGKIGTAADDMKPFL